MAYERTWQFLAPQGPRVAANMGDAASYFAWLLKSWLKGEIGGATTGTYTCVGSCDGVTAALDGVDRWGTVYNQTLIPYSDAPDGIRAWMVLKRTRVVGIVSFDIYLMLSLHGQQAGTNSGLVQGVMGTSLPTNGTTTADPVFAAPFYTHWTANLANRYATDFINNRRYYGGLTSQGDFWFAETITGELSRGWYFAVPVGTKANDQYPFFATLYDAVVSATAGAPFAGGTLFTRNTNNSLGGGQGLYYNGAAGFPQLIQPPLWALLDASETSLFDYPAFVLIASSNAATAIAVHARGRLPDTGLCAGNDLPVPSTMRPVNIGTTIKNLAGDIEYVTLNQIIVPYNALLS